MSFFLNDISPLFALANEIDRASRPGCAAQCAPRQPTFVPRFDVKDTKEAYHLIGELPGVEESAIKIEWAQNNTLSISGSSEKHIEVSSEPESESSSTSASDAGEEAELIEAEDASGYQKPTVSDDETDATVQNEKPAETEAPKEAAAPRPRYWISERKAGSFNRTFKFTNRIDHENVKASLKNGILSIVVPKAKPLEPRRIAIQ